jgi:1-deoxyxylulose-5-phosphate synthase
MPRPDGSPAAGAARLPENRFVTMNLKQRKFGRTDLRVSELCLGTSNFARYANQAESFAMLDAFRAAGGNFIQTSGICPGVNLGDGFLGLPEEVLGRWLNERKVSRDHLVIATRIAFTRPIIGGMASFTELIRSCVHDSIRRIGCGFLDFLVVEWTDAIVPLHESVAAFEAVVASGEVRHIIPANFPAGRTLEALSAVRSPGRSLAGLQLDYSLAVRTAFEAGAARLAADHGLGVITRSPLAGGHLASRRFPASFGTLRTRGASDRFAAIAADGIWPMLAATACARRRSPAQVALAWVLGHPQVASVLVSASSVPQLRELLAATRLTLSADNVAGLGGRPARRVTAVLTS